MIRAEFQNMFNRLFYSTPSDGGGFAAPFTYDHHAHRPREQLSGKVHQGLLSSGLGYVNWVNGGSRPAAKRPDRGAVYVLIFAGQDDNLDHSLPHRLS